MSLPPNFGRAVDLSSLGKPKAEPAGPMPGIEITPENLTNEFLSLSKDKPVVLICWSPRSPESQEVVAILGKLALADQGSWVLGRVDVDLAKTGQQLLAVAAVGDASATLAVVGGCLGHIGSRRLFSRGGTLGLVAGVDGCEFLGMRGLK